MTEQQMKNAGLIAAFMYDEIEYVHKEQYIYGFPYELIDEHNVTDGISAIDTFYHESWGWIMPVVEMINTFSKVESSVTMYSSKIIIQVEYEVVAEIEEFCIESVYEAVVKFIKWYNENK